MHKYVKDTDSYWQDLKLRALELKGYYLVAKAMADTYTEVSAGYIIPGVNSIERLSLPGAKNLTKEERAAKISEVGILAMNAKTEVKRIANQVCPCLMFVQTESSVLIIWTAQEGDDQVYDRQSRGN